MKNKRLCYAEEHGDREGEKTQEHCSRTGSVLSSEANRCLICFDCLLEQEIGFLENCCHVFCLSCILKWAKTVASCPVDRKPFQAVYKFGVSQEYIKIQVKQDTIGKENCSCSKSIKQTSHICAENNCCTRSKACKGPLHAPFGKPFKKQHGNALDSQNDKKKSTSVKINEPRRLTSSHQHFRNDFYNLSPLSDLSGNSSYSNRSLSLDVAEVSDVGAIIRRKREELDSLWSCAMPGRTERISSLCSGFQTEILSVTLSLIRGNMCLLNPASPENFGRACALTHTQDGVEKKQAAGASGNRGSKNKPADTTERRRSTRNSKTKETSQLPGPPNSSNSGSDTPNGNNSSINIEAPAGSKKQHPTQRGKRAAKKTLPAKKKLRSSLCPEELSSSDTQSGDTAEPETIPKFLFQEKKKQSDGELSPTHAMIGLAGAPEQHFDIEMSPEPTCKLHVNADLSLAPNTEQQSDVDLSSIPALQQQPDPEFLPTLIKKQYSDPEHFPAPILERQIDTELLPDLEQQMDDEYYPAPDLERQIDLTPPLERETDAELSQAPTLERELDTELSLAPPLEWEPSTEFSPAPPLERQLGDDLSPASPLKRQQRTKLSPPSPLERQGGAELSPVSLLEHQSGAELSPPSPLERQSEAELSLPSPLEQQSGAELSPPLPLEQQSGAKLSPPLPLEQQSGAELSPPLPLEQQSGVELSPPLPLEQQSGTKLSPPLPLEQQSGAKLSSPLPLKRHSGDELSPALPLEQQSGAELSPASPLEQHSGAELSPALPLEQQSGAELSPVSQQSGAKLSLALPLEWQSGAKLSPVSPLERQFGAELSPVSPLERQPGAELSPVSPLERQPGAELSPVSPLERQPGAELSPVSPLERQPGAQFSPVSPLERQLGAQLSPVSPLERQLGAQISPVSPLERQLGAQLSPVSPLEQQLGAQLSPVSPLEQQLGAQLSPVSPLEQQLGAQLSPVSPLEQQLGAQLSPVSPLEQQPEDELSPASPLERQPGAQLSQAPPLEQELGVQLSPAPLLERQPVSNYSFMKTIDKTTKEIATDISKEQCTVEHSDTCSREPPVLSREECIHKTESRSIKENITAFERGLAQNSTAKDNMPLDIPIGKVFEHLKSETSESTSGDAPECIVQESGNLNSETLSHSVGEVSLFLTEKLKHSEHCEINKEQSKESDNSTKRVSVLHDSLCSNPNESEFNLKSNVKQEKTKGQTSSLGSSDKKDEIRVHDSKINPVSITEKKGDKKETRTRKSRFHSPSTTWSPDKDNRREHKRSRSRSRTQDFLPKQKSRSQSKDKDDAKDEQWRDHSRDRRNRRRSRSRSRSRSQSRSRIRWRDSTFDRNERDDHSLSYRGWWRNDNWGNDRWGSCRGNFRGNDRYIRIDQEKQNENFRKERYDFTRDVAESYSAEKFRNDYPDWIMERIKSEPDNSRNAEKFTVSHWEGKRYSGDSWTKNFSSRSNWNRGRGGNRGRSNFRGGFGYRNQSENRWQSRQPLSGNLNSSGNLISSGNLNSSGNESSRFTEHQNFRRRNEHEYFDSPSDRSGWTSASSWAVRRTLPADVQNYYSKRGRNSSSPQAGWSKPEDEIPEQELCLLDSRPSLTCRATPPPITEAQHLVRVSLQQPPESHPVIPQDPPGVLENQLSFPDPNINDQANQQVDGSQIPVNMMQSQMNVMPPQMNAQHQPMNIFPYPVGVPPPPPPPLMNIQHTPFNLHPQLPMHLHPAVPLMQVSAPSSTPQGPPPPPPPPPPSQQVSYVTSQPDGKQLQDTPAPHVSSNLSTPLVTAPVAVVENEGTVQRPNSANASSSSHNKTNNVATKPAVHKEPVIMEVGTDNSKKDKKLQIQERAAEEVKLAIKPFYQNKDITKEEYKEIVRKAVDKVCHSKSGEVDSAKVANLVKAYVDKYKHSRKGILKKNTE